MCLRFLEKNPGLKKIPSHDHLCLNNEKKVMFVIIRWVYLCVGPDSSAHVCLQCPLMTFRRNVIRWLQSYRHGIINFFSQTRHPPTKKGKKKRKEKKKCYRNPGATTSYMQDINSVCESSQR